MKPIRYIVFIFTLIALLAAVSGAQATIFTYTPFDVPGGSGTTVAQGINNSGQICGYFTNSNVTAFLFNGAGFTNFKLPGASDTYARDLNNHVQIVGDTFGRGWFYNGSGFSNIAPLGSMGTFVNGLDDSGQIVGYYFDPFKTGALSPVRGFLFNGTSTESFDFPYDPGAGTYAYDINTQGHIVGWSADDKSLVGFLKEGDSYTTIRVPGSTYTKAYGINELDHIVGEYLDAKGVHGFFYDGVSFTTLDFPGTNKTYAYGINDLDQVVGYFSDSKGDHGFLAVDPPGAPLPSTLWLLGSGLLGLGALQRKRRMQIKAFLR